MKLKTKQVVLMGMFGALAAVLMLFEVPLPFIAPSFYGLDISEVPVLVGTFAMGPVAGIVIEAVKILVKLLLKPSTTGFVGEFANFVIGCSLVVPAVTRPREALSLPWLWEPYLWPLQEPYSTPW